MSASNARVVRRRITDLVFSVHWGDAAPQAMLIYALRNADFNKITAELPVAKYMTPDDTADEPGWFQVDVPLSVGTATGSGAPDSTALRSVSISALMAKALPVWRWQSRQWQQWTIIGPVFSR